MNTNMPNRKIKIGFTDTFSGLSVPYFLNQLSKKFDVVHDDETPDILIFGDENFGTNNLTFDQSKTIKVFYTGENRRYWNYKCHRGMTFDHWDGDIHFRLPLYVVEIWGMINQLGYCSHEDIHDKIAPTSFHSENFCAYINSNPHCVERTNFVQHLSTYKKVNCWGPHLNNVGHVVPRGTKNKTDVFSKHKFAICYENGSYPGYVTEKLVHAFYSRTVPIYWGSATVEVDFNTKAFLNRHDYETDDDFIRKIIEVDQNEHLYNSILNEPMFTENKVPKFMNADRMNNWFERNVIQYVQ